MLYHFFIHVMDFLDITFGYVWAIRIKLILLLLTGGSITTITSALFTADFFLNVDKNPLISSKATIVAPTEDNPNYTSDPQNFKESLEVYVRYFFIRVFHKSDIAIRNLRVIMFVYSLIILALIFFALLLSLWVYLPPTMPK